MSMGYELLIASQFTLMCQLKGNKPDFHSAMKPEIAKIFFNEIINKLKLLYSSNKVKCGQFGTYCEIEIINDGPVTIELNTDGMTFESEKLKTEILQKRKQKQAESRKMQIKQSKKEKEERQTLSSVNESNSDKSTKAAEG